MKVTKRGAELGRDYRVCCTAATGTRRSGRGHPCPHRESHAHAGCKARRNVSDPCIACLSLVAQYLRGKPTLRFRASLPLAQDSLTPSAPRYSHGVRARCSEGSEPAPTSRPQLVPYLLGHDSIWNPRIALNAI